MSKCFQRNQSNAFGPVRRAPSPEDIVQENLGNLSKGSKISFFCVNFVIIGLIVLGASPRAILNAIGGQQLSDFWSSLIVSILGSLLPSILAFSDTIYGHWRRSDLNRWTFRKTLVVLLCMVLVPSIGVNSIFQAFFALAKTSNGSSTYAFSFNCQFLPSNT